MRASAAGRDRTEGGGRMSRPRLDKERDGIPPCERERKRWERAMAAALRGPSVSRSARSRQLLTYLVGETLAGRRHRINGITIAQDVLGRDASFDSESDAIVRVQMRRLRVQLAEDQASGALGDAPWIAVPKGAYRPELTAPPAPRPAAPDAARAPKPAAPALAEPTRPWLPAPPASSGGSRGATRAPRRVLFAALALLGAAALWLGSDDVASFVAEAPKQASLPAAPPATADYPTVAVLPFKNRTGDPRNDAFSSGLQLQIASDLQRFGTVRVLAPEGPPPAENEAQVDYLVGGSLLAVEDELEAFVFLTDAETGRAVLSRRVEESAAAVDGPGAYYALLTRLSNAVSGRILGEHGSLARLEGEKSGAAGALRSGGVAAFRCLALTQAFRRSRDAGDFLRARDCLDERLREGGDEATLLAYKALLLSHALPHLGLMDTSGVGAPPTEAEVLETARRAVSLDPGSDVAHAVQGLMLNAMGEREAAIVSLRRAADLNSGNPTVHAMLGIALVSDERWEEARDAGTRAVALSADPEPYFFLPAFLAALAEDDPDAAVAAGAEVARSPAPWSAAVRLVAADLAGETGVVEDLKREVRAYAESQGGDPLAGLRRWAPTPTGLAALERRLAALGIAVTEPGASPG